MPNDKDYDADGSLIVDPQKMMKDGYSDIGKLLGFCMVRFVEKKWVKFQPVLNRQTLAAGIAGAILLLFLKKTVKQPCVALCGDNWGRVISQVVLMFYILVLFPMVLSKVQKKAETISA